MSSETPGDPPKLFSKKREAALVALLTTPTFKAAAAAASVTTRTLRRWLREPRFLAEWRRRRSEIYELNIALAELAIRSALTTLIKNLSCGKFPSENQAALGLIGFKEKGRDVGLAEEVEELKTLVQTLIAKRKKREE
jgi:hypothetical protein